MAVPEEFAYIAAAVLWIVGVIVIVARKLSTS
jgi:hypothetical protein